MSPKLSSDVSRPAIPWSGATVTAEVDVEPGTQEGAMARHVALVIDTSGSMGGEKIAQAREGASWIFGLLDDEDYITIVSFDSEAEFVMRPTQWAETSREAAMTKIDDLTAGGGTDMYDGLETAGEALRSIGYGSDDDAVRRVLLLSDGKDNSHEPEDFTALAEDLDGMGIRIQSAGIGEDYEEETIRTLGTTARGEWTHLEAPGDIEQFFGDAVEEASEVVAPDAQLELDVAPGVEITDVYRALPQAQDVDPEWVDNTGVVKLPDLTEREHQRVVLKVHAPAMDGIPEDEESDSVLAERRADGPREDEHHKLVDLTLTAKGAQATGIISVEYTDDNEKLAQNHEDVDLDHRQTVVSTELGRGNVETAETQIEKMTRIHGEDTRAVKEAERQTELVKEGGRAERNRATKIVADDDRVRS
jgi:Ca-activated chloride channel family protein